MNDDILTSSADDELADEPSPVEDDPEFAEPEASDEPGSGALAAARGAQKRPGLCALEGRFQQGFVQCRQRAVYKPPFEQGRQCTKSGSTAARPCVPGRVRKPS